MDRAGHDRLVEADHRHLWHPFTQMQGWLEEEPLIVDRAEGVYLVDTLGRRYLDGVSSLWCNVHGHRVPEIDAAVRAQLGIDLEADVAEAVFRDAIRAIRTRGVDPRILPGTPVTVHASGSAEELPGVVVIPPARALPATAAGGDDKVECVHCHQTVGHG